MFVIKEDVGDLQFAKNANLDYVLIEEDVERIGEKAFVDCPNLETVRINATTPPTIQSNTFPDTVQRYEVPAESVEAYKTATNWSKYADKIFAIE